MKTYELIENSYGETVIKRTDENGEIAWIPCDEANSDYQRYLRWLKNPDAEEGGTL